MNLNLRYEPALDGIRAFAVLGVLISHYSFGNTFNGYYVSNIPWGHIGVRVFFVLSGFLITTILLNSISI